MNSSDQSFKKKPIIIERKTEEIPAGKELQAEMKKKEKKGTSSSILLSFSFSFSYSSFINSSSFSLFSHHFYYSSPSSFILSSVDSFSLFE